MDTVIELASSYGLWIALIALFLAMHWFGIRCCGHRHLEHTERLYTATGSQDHRSDKGRRA